MSTQIKIGIVDYAMGNTGSIRNAFARLGVDTDIVSDAAKIKDYDALVLPGVGAFGKAMEELKKRDLIEPLNQHALIDKKPILGICLGMQIMVETSQEHGTHEGLGWIAGAVKRFPAAQVEQIPHVGWSEITPTDDNYPLFSSQKEKATFYFDHSYVVQCPDDYVSSTCTYGPTFTASLHHNNIHATQFHPEKSQYAGLRLLRQFINLCQSEVCHAD